MIFEDNELIQHKNLGLVRMYEYGDKKSCVRVLNEDLKSWTVRTVYTSTLSKLKTTCHK